MTKRAKVKFTPEPLTFSPEVWDPRPLKSGLGSVTGWAALEFPDFLNHQGPPVPWTEGSVDDSENKDKLSKIDNFSLEKVHSPSTPGELDCDLWQLGLRGGANPPRPAWLQVSGAARG